MNISQAYILISVIVLAIIAALVFFTNKKRKGERFTPLAGFAFAFVLAGIFFGDNRLAGYSLIGAGVVLAVIDIVRKSKKKGK